MSEQNKRKITFFTEELFQEKWESRIKFQMPIKIEEMKIMFKFLKLQAGQSTNSTTENINTIARCAALIKNPDKVSELWFKDYFERCELYIDVNETFIDDHQNYLNEWSINPNIDDFIQYPYTELEGIKNYFDFFTEHFRESFSSVLKYLPTYLVFIPWIAVICLQCLAKKPASVSYALKSLGNKYFSNHKFIPISKQLFEILQNLPIEPMKSIKSEAVNVLLMFLKLYNDGAKTLSTNQKEFINSYLLNHLKGNGIQLAYIFYKHTQIIYLAPNKILDIYRHPIVSTTINKSVNRLQEFIDFYGYVNENNLLWWSRLLDRNWMVEFSTTMNKRLILRMAPTLNVNYMQVVRNASKHVRHAANEYSEAVRSITLSNDPKFTILERIVSSYPKNNPLRFENLYEKGMTKKLIFAHLNI